MIEGETCISLSALLKKPSAYVPIAMSIAALIVVLGAVIFFGAGDSINAEGRPDEGAAAHIFQLLMVCGFNRWTQQIGEIVQRVFRSLAFSLGGCLVASLLHLAWLASRWKYPFPWGNTAAIAHLYFHWSPAAKDSEDHRNRP